MLDIQNTKLKYRRNRRIRDYEEDMITSIDTVTQVSIMFRNQKKENKKIGITVEHNTKNTYEYDDKCVRVWKRREMRIHV